MYDIDPLTEIGDARTRRGVGRRGRRDRLDVVVDLLRRIDAALVVRDPGSARSADVFEGLRRQVLASAGDRRRHLVQLTEFAEAVRRGDDPAALRSRVEEWLVQANVQVIDTDPVAGRFDISGPADGDTVSVVVPAYVDGATGAVIRQGIAERIVGPKVPQPHIIEDTVGDAPASSVDVSLAASPESSVPDAELTPDASSSMAVAEGSDGSTDRNEPNQISGES